MVNISRIVIAGLIILLLAISAFSAGCARNRDTGISAPSPVATSGMAPATAEITRTAAATGEVTWGGSLKTCSQLGGTETGPGQTCQQAYLPASDSFSCCPVKPAGPAPGSAVLTIEPFTTLEDDGALADITG